ncbi:MAG: MFS transporter, partial [Vicinamibacteraceae bacterium]|nr:MFS transporter [Vicinamibacteraceae bacterium]
STESAPAALIGGSAWDGFRNAIRSPYLRGIVVHMLLFTVLTTFLYFQQAAIVDTAMTDRAARTRFFANIDLLVNVLTLLTQVFATGRLVHAIGLPASLAFLPVLTIVGFTTLGMAPTIAVLMAFQVIRRSSEFAIARPSREVLFTVVSREDRYKAKNFIDTFVYRAGDQLGAWGYAVLVAVGLGTLGISSVAVVLSVVAVFVALWLGRRQRREAAHVADAA